MNCYQTYSEIWWKYELLHRKKADFSIILSSLLEKIDLNVCSADGDNLYHLAGLYLDSELVNFLAAQGIKSPPNHSGDTAFHSILNISSWEKRAARLSAVTQSLIKAGVDFNGKDNSGRTLAYSCIKKANWAVLMPLIQAGIKLDEVVEEEKNLLHLICYAMSLNKGYKKLVSNGKTIIKLLLDSGQINPEDKDMFDTTPVTYLQRAGLLDVAALFFKDEDNTTGGMPIDEAILYKNYDVVNILLARGVEANSISRKYNNESLLMLACGQADSKMVELLLNAGADPNNYAITGENCLYSLLCKGFRAIHCAPPPPGKMPPQIQTILHLLKKKGWNPSQRCDAFENTVLHYVAMPHVYMMDAREDVLQCLLELGADANSIDRNGATPLMIYAACCSRGSKNIAFMPLLIEAGANVNIQDNEGQTVLHYMVHNTDTISARHVARQILAKDSNLINTKDNHGQTVLHLAVKNETATMTKFLIENKVDVNVITNDGESPLRMAVHNKNMELIELLLQAGADPLLAGPKTQSALHYAVISDYKPIISRMLEVGVDMNAKDCYGNTLLGIATKHHHHDLVEFLIDQSIKQAVIVYGKG